MRPAVGREYKNPASHPEQAQYRESRTDKQLTQLWRQHRDAGCPSQAQGVEIAGTDALALDAEITSAASAVLAHTLTVDDRIERRLARVSLDLVKCQVQAEPQLAEYYARLNGLVSALLVRTRVGRS